jgi:hypothetical protein
MDERHDSRRRDWLDQFKLLRGEAMKEQKLEYRGMVYILREMSGKFQVEILSNGFRSGWWNTEAEAVKDARQLINSYVG